MISLTINTVEKRDEVIRESLVITQQLTNLVDSATFSIRKYGSRSTTPAFNDDVIIKDTAGTTVFAGKIIKVTESAESGGGGVLYSVQCVDHTWEMDKLLVSKTYEGDTIEEIIDDIISTYASGFTTVNVSSGFTIDKIVFNQVSISSALKRLAVIIGYDFYIDFDKDVHFFAKNTESSPFNLTDSSGNYIYKSLKLLEDGSQVVNKVKVRGGEYDGDTFTDDITVNGSDTKSFNVPYRFDAFTVELNTGGGLVAQTVGIDNIDDFSSYDVLYNYQEKTFRFETALADADVVRFSGSPKVPTLAVAQDSASIALYGTIEKIIRDNTIEDLDVARKRAAAELLTYAIKSTDGEFRTYTGGLRAGQTINVNSTLRDKNVDLIIKTLTLKMHTEDDFIYSAKLVSTKRYDFISLLQKFLEPDPKQADENEVSEAIFAIDEEVVITENIEVVTPEADNATVTITTDEQNDPLGAGIEPTWVLGEYFPTSITDTKRQGKLDRSMKLY